MTNNESSRRLPHVLGVVDLAGGRAVHAVAGERAKYAPVEAPGIATGDAVALASRYLAAGVAGLYVADLDAIGGEEPQRDVLRSLVALGAPVWLDAGLGEVAGALRAVERLGLSDAPVRWVAATETLRGLSALAALVERLGPDRVVAGLDLRQGRTLSDAPALAGVDPPVAARRLAAAGAAQCVVLDLALVGTRAGPALAGTVASIRRAAPALRLAVGGGVRTAADVGVLRAAGADAVLVGTALHRGELPGG